MSTVLLAQWWVKRCPKGGAECPLYACIVLSLLRLGLSPPWVQEILLDFGLS